MAAEPFAPARLGPLTLRNRIVKAATFEGASPRGEVSDRLVEVHLGHGYLLSSFLSPKLNRRTDAYGGDLGARARFPREVLRDVRTAVGRDRAVTVKLNMTDGVDGGFWLEESVKFARMLQDD